MKPIEVFLKYCKIRGIVGEVKSMENFKQITKYRYDAGTRKYVEIRLMFKDTINLHVNEFGFRYLFNEIENLYCKNRCFSEKYLKAKRLWNDFCRNNVKISNPLNKGDKITVRFSLEGEIQYEFVEYTNDHNAIIVLKDGKRQKIFLGTRDIICLENGEEYEADFFIKWKGKEYYGIEK